MDRRKSLALLGGGLGAVIAGPRSSSGEDVSIPVFAHYMNWAKKTKECWGPAAQLPAGHPTGYSSDDPAVIAAQNVQMTANGILPMVSWWARETYAGDEFLNLYLGMPGPQIGILYEALGYSRFRLSAAEEIDMGDQQNADLFISDMAHLQEKYFSRYPDRFYRIDGRPVVFIYISHAFTGPFDRVVAQARRYSAFFLVGSEFLAPWGLPLNHEPVLRAMDAISSYGPFDVSRYGSAMDLRFLVDYRRAVYQWSEWLAKNSPATRLLLPMCFSYDDRKIPGRLKLHFESSPGIARQFAELVRSLITGPCEPDCVLSVPYITSWSELFEGSAILPSDRYGDSYLRIINETFNVPRRVDPNACDIR